MAADRFLSEQSLASCHETLATAAALGMPVPGIPGMRLYVASVSIDDDRIEVELGTFCSDEDAKRAVAVWVIREMYELGIALGTMALNSESLDDWDEETFSNWVQATPPETIVGTFFSNHHVDSWRIREIIVEPKSPQGPLSLEDAVPGSARLG